MSGKPIQAELIQDQNCLTNSNGCAVIYASSEDARAPASNILDDNQKKIWMTANELPQQCIISIQNITKCPPTWNVIGFYCWHQFDTNPALIQLHIRIQNSQKWNLLAKIRLTLIDGWQYFKCQQIDCNKTAELKICITKNYGSDRTYLNQVALHYINFATLIPTVRQSRSTTLHQKTAVQTEKMRHPSTALFGNNNYDDNYNQKQNKGAETQKQLVKANQKIIYLCSQQQKMKKTIMQQGEIMIKLESKVKTILEQLQKLYYMQQKLVTTQTLVNSRKQEEDGDSLEQQQQNQHYESTTKNKDRKKINPQKLNQMLKMIDESVVNSTKPHYNMHPPHASVPPKSKGVPKNNAGVGSKKTLHYRKPALFADNDALSLHRQMNDDEQIIRITSQQNFSEYSPTKYPHLYATHNSRSKMSATKNKEELVHKIKLLLQLKQQKKSEMSSKKSRDNRDRWSAQQSNSGTSQKYNGKGSLNKLGLEHVWGEQSEEEDEQYFKKIKHRKSKVNCF